MELYFGHGNMGGLFVEQERWEEAVPSLERSLQVLEALEKLGGSYEQERVETHSWLRSAHLPQMKFAQAEFHNQQELLGYEALLEEEPANARNQLQLVVANRGTSSLALIRNDTQAALEYLLPQSARLDQLHAVEPEDTSVIEQQALLLGQLTEVRLLREEWGQAGQLAERCQKLSGELLLLNEENVFWSTGLNWPCRHTAARADFHLGQLDSAQAQLDAYYPALVAEHRANPDLKGLDRVLVESLVLLGDIALVQGRKAQANEYWQRAKTVVDVELDHTDPRVIASLVGVLNRLNETGRARELVEYLYGANYQHPALLRETLASR